MRIIFFQILSLFNKRERQAFGLLLAAMVFSAFSEAISIGLFVPFTAMISDPDLIYRSGPLSLAYKFFQINSSQQFFVTIGLLLILAVIVKNGAMFLLGLVQGKFLARLQVQIEKRLLGAYLRAPITFMMTKNTSELFNKVRNISILVGHVVQPTFAIISELIVVSIILCLLFAVQPLATLGALLFLGILMFFIYAVSRRYLTNVGEGQVRSSVEAIKWIQQGFGGAKEIKVMGIVDFVLGRFEKSSFESCNSNMKLILVNSVPRMLVESASISLMTGFVIFAILAGYDTRMILPTLILFGVANIRVMPSANRIVGSMMAFRQNSFLVKEILDDLESLEAAISVEDMMVEAVAAQEFDKDIRFENVSYSYPGTSAEVLRNVSFKIEKGKLIALAGKSGAGKSTLVDILLGLLRPQSGDVLVDGRSVIGCSGFWQRRVGFVPQFIFLSDDSIRRNIAFGVADSDIVDERVWKALEQAKVDSFVASLPAALDANVGERGVRLSGGQRQRLGIARALYHDPDLLIFDEATSAIDNETELAITESIQRLRQGKTIIVIAHRFHSIKNADRVYFLSDGKLIQEGSLDELLNSNKEFCQMYNI